MKAAQYPCHRQAPCESPSPMRPRLCSLLPCRSCRDEEGVEEVIESPAQPEAAARVRGPRRPGAFTARPRAHKDVQDTVLVFEEFPLWWGDR